MTMDLSGSDFDISTISAFDSEDVQLTDVDSSPSTLTVHDLLHGGDYMFVIEGASGVESGTFDLHIACSSDSPTTSPTTDPTMEPSTDPTKSPSDVPTTSPTAEPSSEPTTSPSTDPTVSPTYVPTNDPSQSPTTPAPTHPGEPICGSHEVGQYNGLPVHIEVRMPYDGEMILDLSASDFEIMKITSYDSEGVELTNVFESPSVLTLHELKHSEDYFFVIEGETGVSQGTFDLVIGCSSDAPTQSPSSDPTVDPTADPSADPTASPSRDPTASPSSDPTNAPSREPTSDPTEYPTPAPTGNPTPAPTDQPTSDPTKSPTRDPTSSPTTPAPTHPGELICGSHESGDYNGEAMHVEVRMPYDGDMTLDLSGSDFEIGSITAFDSNSLELNDVDPSASALTLHDLTHSEDYWFVIEGADGVSSGTFDIVIVCSSDSPTRSPSTDPTVDPTTDPTLEPSPSPTDSPTPAPTDVPTETPTKAPTTDPTSSPTTPAPTHPGELICGSHTTGAYNGEAMHVEVRMPYDGDMTVDLSASDFQIGMITAYDSRNVELIDVDPSASALTVHDLTHSGDYLFVIVGAEGVHRGTFDIVIRCSSDAPTRSPTTDPTKAPSEQPTSAPTNDPTADPTMEPTNDPTADPTLYPSADPSS